MKKSTIGFVLAAGATILALSPQARNAVRRMAVKVTQNLLEFNEERGK